MFGGGYACLHCFRYSVSSGYRRSKKGVKKGECLNTSDDENVESLESIETNSLAEMTQSSVPPVNMGDIVSAYLLLSKGHFWLLIGRFFSVTKAGNLEYSSSQGLTPPVLQPRILPPAPPPGKQAIVPK